MRLTLSLLSPRHWINMRGASWYKAKKRRIPDDVNIQRIIDSGHNVVEATEFVKTMSPLYAEHPSHLPDVPSRFPVPLKLDRNNPDWHDEICKVFDNTTFPIEGVQQALAFTKAVKVSEGLPSGIVERANSLELTEKDHEFAQRIIQQAFIWDSYLEKLPNVRHVDYPSISPRRDYGTPWERTNEIMMSNFIRLIESKFPSTLSLSRMIAPQEELRVNLLRHKSLVQFRLNAIAHVMSPNIMRPALSKNEVEETKVLPLCDIYPFLSTANMEEVNVYKEGDHFCVSPSSKFSNIHTSIYSHHIPGSFTHLHPRWTDDRFAGATIMYNFASALLVAKRKFGQINGDLPEPVTTQVIHLTGKEFQFSVFQLNTLDLEGTSSTSVKNNVWVTDKMHLCADVRNDHGQEIFEGYNPEVLKLVTSLYLSEA